MPRKRKETVPTNAGSVRCEVTDGEKGRDKEEVTSPLRESTRTTINSRVTIGRRKEG